MINVQLNSVESRYKPHIFCSVFVELIAIRIQYIYTVRICTKELRTDTACTSYLRVCWDLSSSLIPDSSVHGSPLCLIWALQCWVRSFNRASEMRRDTVFFCSIHQINNIPVYCSKNISIFRHFTLDLLEPVHERTAFGKNSVSHRLIGKTDCSNPSSLFTSLSSFIHSVSGIPVPKRLSSVVIVHALPNN